MNIIDTAKRLFVRLNRNIISVNSVIIHTKEADLCISIATIVVKAYMIYFSLLKANMLNMKNVTARHCLSSKKTKFFSNSMMANSARVRR